MESEMSYADERSPREDEEGCCPGAPPGCGAAVSRGPRKSARVVRGGVSGEETGGRAGVLECRAALRPDGRRGRRREREETEEAFHRLLVAPYLYLPGVQRLGEPSALVDQRG